MSPSQKNSSPHSSHELIDGLKFCVFDLETTGGNHQTDKIIEIGMVKVENREIVASRDFLIRPEIKIPDFIQRLTNISQKDVKDAPLIEDTIDEILEFMGDSILVAHNTSFDVPFLNSVLKRLGRPELTNNTLCTNLMTKYLIPNLMNSNLNYMSKIFKIKHHKAHRALDDALATAELLIKYLSIFAEKKIKKINHLYYPRNRYELDRTNFKKNDSLSEISKKLETLKCPALVTLKGGDGIILYSLPYRGSDSDYKVIMQKIEQMDWETMTIKLYGPIIETFIHLNTLFTKLETHIRQDILDHLWKEYLPNESPHDARPENETQGLNDYDFFITHHLVPDQLMIYPLKALHPRSELVFRYPGHRKKLLQYINSKSARMKSNRLQKVHYHPHLKIFIDRYIQECTKNNSELLLFSRKLPQKKPNEFYMTIDKYLDQNKNPYNFPREFI